MFFKSRLETIALGNSVLMNLFIYLSSMNDGSLNEISIVPIKSQILNRETSPKTGGVGVVKVASKDF